MLGWRLIPNAHLIDRESSILALELEHVEAKDRAISQIGRIDGVVLIQSFYGKTLQVTVFSESEEELRKQMNAISSVGRGKIFTHWKVNLPKCNLKAKRID